MNPRSKDGKLYPCWNCGGLTHLAKNCPESGLTLIVDNKSDIEGLEDHIRCDYVVRGGQDTLSRSLGPVYWTTPG